MKLSAINRKPKPGVVRWRMLTREDVFETGDEVRLGTDRQPVPRSMIGTTLASADSVHGRRKIGG